MNWNDSGSQKSAGSPEIYRGSNEHVNDNALDITSSVRFKIYKTLLTVYPRLSITGLRATLVLSLPIVCHPRDLFPRTTERPGPIALPGRRR